jgi:hypothetical protein
VIKDAIISDCGLYRYSLTRTFNYTDPCLQIVMLNPSTADADIDDPTIRRCVNFALREKFGGICVTNLFAFRATSPQDMKRAADPVGPDNHSALEIALRDAKADGSPVLCAWGTHGEFGGRDKWFRQLAKTIGTDLVHLGLTKDGHPKHPLYVKSDQPFGVLY